MKLPTWLIELSVWLCFILNGPPGYSLCAWMYEAQMTGSRVAKGLTKTTDRLFFFDPQHCRKAWLLRNREFNEGLT